MPAVIRSGLMLKPQAAATAASSASAAASLGGSVWAAKGFRRGINVSLLPSTSTQRWSRRNTARAPVASCAVMAGVASSSA